MADIDNTNPFESPEAEAAPAEENFGGVIPGEAVFKALRASSPWMRFLGIVGFAVAGITLLTGIGICATGGAAVLQSGGFAATLAAAGLGIGLGVVYIGVGTLIFLPSFFLFNAGLKLRNWAISRNGDDLDAAMKFNYSFWKFAGVVAIIVVALIPVFIIFAISAAAFGFITG